MKKAFLAAIGASLLLSCSKNNQPAGDDNSPLTGEWQQGPYDISNFWQPSAWITSNPQFTTGAFHFADDGTAQLYGIGFPTLETDCAKQDFRYTRGVYTVNMQDSTLTFIPQAGKLRTFYKNCPAIPDVNKDLFGAELGNAITFYWRLRNENGKDYLLIRYSKDATAFTWMEKMN